MLGRWVLAEDGQIEGISQIQQGLLAFRATGAEVSALYLPFQLRRIIKENRGRRTCGVIRSTDYDKQNWGATL